MGHCDSFDSYGLSHFEAFSFEKVKMIGIAAYSFANSLFHM